MVRIKDIILVSLGLFILLLLLLLLGLGLGSSEQNLQAVMSSLLGLGPEKEITASIIWKIRFPRVILAALTGGTLGLGGLVFQALLRNPLAEPYILGISGGSAVGAISGMLLGLAIFPGVALLAFAGSMLTLVLVVIISSGHNLLKENSLLLAGVMVNAFCSSIIMFLISVTSHTKLQNALFWLMGDLSRSMPEQVYSLLLLLLPCFVFVYILAKPMNIMLLGKETAKSLGVNVTGVNLSLLAVSSLMVSATVCLSGLVGFVGLVIPHLLRLLLGADHRLLVPSCLLGGASFLVACDLLARTLPAQGELPVGVITAIIGAPAFIFLLYRSKR